MGQFGSYTDGSPAQTGDILLVKRGTTTVRTTAGSVADLSDAEVSEVADDLAAHIADATAAHAASAVAFTPAGSIAATTVQAALAELDGEKQPLDADLTALAAAGNSAVLAATTASFTTADEAKLDGIEALADVTDAANVASAGAGTFRSQAEHVVVTPGAMIIGIGAPAVSIHSSIYPGWALDKDAVLEALLMNVDVPATWATYDLGIRWTNAGAGSGDVAWNVVRKSATDGQALNTNSVTVTTAITAPAQDVVKFSTLLTGITRTTGDALQAFSVGRAGSNVGDTLGNDATLLDVRIWKAS